MQKTWVRSLSQEDPLEEEMATHSSILAWRSPWTEEPGPQSKGLHHKESGMTERLSLLFAIKWYSYFIYWESKDTITPGDDYLSYFLKIQKTLAFLESSSKFVSMHCKM